jgi:ribosomal-protein-alanine N-acetyltransferase
MDIEPLNETHTAQLTDIEVRVYPDDAWCQKDFIHYLSYGYSFGTFHDGVLSGYIIGNPEGADLHLGNMAVDFPYRRRGIGRSLLHHVEQTALQNRFTRLTLETRVSNHTAIALYKSEGYQIERVWKEFYIDNDEDALVMIKECSNVPMV